MTLDAQFAGHGDFHDVFDYWRQLDRTRSTPTIGKRNGVNATAANLNRHLHCARADVLRFATVFRAALTISGPSAT